MWYDFILFVHHVVWLIYSTLGMLYQSLLLIGAIGLTAQAVLGFAHGGGHHGGEAQSGGHGNSCDVHLASAPAHAGHAGMTHVGAGAIRHAAPTPAASGRASGRMANASGKAASPFQQKLTGVLWTLFSPLTIFSFCLGVGATGLILHFYLSGPWTALLSLLGGVLFYKGVVRPIWNLIFQFASKPAETLSGALACEAVAMSAFDAQGKGIVRVTVDGQLVRLLAFLDRQDKEKGVTVVPGDKLVVTGVDGPRNTCTVTRL